MRKTIMTFLAGVISVVIVAGPILLFWVRNEREQRCEDTNQNIAGILKVATITREFMNTFIQVLVSFSDPNDPEAQAKVEAFLDGMQPAFDQFDNAITEIQFLEC